MPTTYHQFARVGMGPAQGQVGADYPLIAPSDDVRYLIADFRLVMIPSDWPSQTPPSEDNSLLGEIEVLTYPIKISWLSGFGTLPPTASGTYPPVNAKDIQLVDGNGNILFDSADPRALPRIPTDFSDRVVTPWLSVASWYIHIPYYKGVGSLTTQYGYRARVTVFYYTANSLEEFSDYPSSFRPQNAAVLPRTVFFDDHRQGFVLPDLEEGYNVSFELRKNLADTSIIVSASAGAGLGDAPCDIWGPRPAKEVGAIYSINKQKPDKYGNFLLSPADDCWSTAKTEADTRIYTDIFGNTNPLYNFGHALHLNQTCRACPDCDDYNDLIERANVAIRKYNTIAAEFPELRDRLKTLINTWNDNVLDNKRNRLQLVVIPQICPMFDIAITYTNFSNLPKENVVVSLDVTALTGTLPNSTVLLQGHGQYGTTPENNRSLNVTWPNITVTFAKVAAFRSEYAVLSVPLGGEGNLAAGMIDPTDYNSTGLTVRVTANIAVDGRVKRAGADWAITADTQLECNYTVNPIYPMY